MTDDLGARLKAARERAHLTQPQLGKLLGVGGRTIGNWERGETVPRNRMGALQAFLDEGLITTATLTVGGAPEDPADSELRYQRPPGLTDEAWEALRRDIDSYAQWQIDRAAKER